MSFQRSPGCKCCDCSAPVAVAGCSNSMIVGADLEVFSGGGLASLTSPVFGSGYATRPSAVVTGDGACAKVAVTWSAGAGSSGNSGATNGGTFADDSAVGSVTWSNPSNAQFADGILSRASLSSGDTSHYHKTTNFGFAVPTGATVVGIKFEVKANTDTGAANENIVKLVVGGTVSGTNKSTGATPNGTYFVYGGASDLWGLTPTYTQVNASNFGAVISYTDNDITDSVDIDIDHTRMTVYWTTAGGITGYTIADAGVGYTAATITILPGSDGSGTGASVSATVAARTSESTCTTAGKVAGVRVLGLSETTVFNTGWTNGTNYALIFSGGTPSAAATGLFDVLSTKIANIRLTSGGADYDSTPTVDFSNGGAGTAASEVLMRASCALGIPAPGRYMVEATTPAGQVDRICVTTPCASSVVGVVNFGDLLHLTVNELMTISVGSTGFAGVAGIDVTLTQGAVTLGPETTDDNGIATFTLASLLATGTVNFSIASIDGAPFAGTFAYLYTGAAVQPDCSYAVHAGACTFPNTGTVSDGTNSFAMRKVGGGFALYQGFLTAAGKTVYLNIVGASSPSRLSVFWTINPGGPTEQNETLALTYLQGTCSPFSVVFEIAEDLVVGVTTVYAAGTTFTVTA